MNNSIFYTIAIVGRSNVGKTTIFNRLVKKKAIVANDFGVTRDRNEVLFKYYDLDVKLIDSAGIEYKNANKNVIEKQMFAQAINSIELSDLCLFVIDGKTGILDKDKEVFDILRKKNKTTILVVNKAENFNNIQLDKLNIFNTKDKILLSAEHNIGFNDLYKSIKKQYDSWISNKEKIDFSCCAKNNNSKIRIAILGRPNVGKSTFLNNLLNENRLITSNIAGTTRDKIELDFTHNGCDFVLIDTAGIRKKHKKGNILECMSIENSFEALQFADVVIMLMDITSALEEQDLSLCNRVCQEGRIPVLCFNKWDLVSKNKEKEIILKLKNIIYKNIHQTKGIIFFTCSALNDNNLRLILDEICKLYIKWSIKMPSNILKKKVEKAKKISNNIINELKIRYINQIKSRPPTFVVFSGKNKEYITPHRINSLKNWIYREFCLLGVPIRISVREKKSK